MAKKTNKPNSELLEMMNLAFAEYEAALGIILSLYSLKVSPETYKQIFAILDSAPDSKKWKKAPKSLLNLLGDGDLSTSPLMEKYPEMTHEIMMTLLAGQIKNFSEGRNNTAKGDHDDIWENEFVDVPLDYVLGKTLVLKIKMKQISNPPVWRQVEVPAWYSFEDLHDTIQILFGWADYHLWHFQGKLAKSPYIIKFEDEDSFYEEEAEVISPDTTIISSFLKKKGDKMEYLYDYGDYWVHEISVVDVLDKETDFPVLLQAKGSMMIEDVGGPFRYMQVRDFIQRRSSMNKDERLEAVHSMGFDSEEHFDEWTNFREVNIPQINDELEILGE